MVDKNLFPYNLAVVAIFKDEAPYLREWLDYHLLAGVEHFYLYNNDSSDDYEKILAPYVEANLVTLIDWSGKAMQMPAYNDALEKHRSECRYMAFIDLDEFIFPKTGQSIVEVADEIFSRDSKIAALKFNWQCFGSNGHEKADYSKGVLERFTRRAPSDWVFEDEEINKTVANCNAYVKIIVNPRAVDCVLSPHHAICFEGLHSVNTDGEENEKPINYPVATDKIVVNHYYTKSREEFMTKINRGSAYRLLKRKDVKNFEVYNHNEIFDNGILKYRNARAENFSLESDEQRRSRVEKVLIDMLTKQSPFDAPPEFFTGKLETFLTCRKLLEVFGSRIGNRSAEEFALVWIYQTLTQAPTIAHAEIQMFLKHLPEILSRPFPLSQKILRLTCDGLIPTFCEALKEKQQWEERTRLLDLQKFLRLIK
ncbi:MAG: glycosyltransferase family 92 protein [Selenomonadaceae bacterium]|nr:glycosyltransferase family 92 protein [Selenomonadaceae bacterium]